MVLFGYSVQRVNLFKLGEKLVIIITNLVITNRSIDRRLHSLITRVWVNNHALAISDARVVVRSRNPRNHTFK